jgi:Protein of unknown function (DUF1761)
VFHVHVNLVAVLVAGVVAFVVGWLWYSPMLFLNPWMRARGLDPASMAGGKMSMGKMVAELVRCLLLAFLLAHLVGEFHPTTWTSAVHYGIFLWVTLPVMLFWGAAMWENQPPKASIIDAGDWLVKLLVIPLILFFMK